MRKLEDLIQAHRLKLTIAVLSFTLLSGTAAWSQGHGNAFRYKDIEIGFTTQFTWLYDDGGTGAHRSGSVWRPVPQAGFYSIGDVFRPDHGNPNNRMVAFTVKPLRNGAVQFPTGYDVIWNDGGSGGRHDGAIYVPRCPSGYHYLGHAGGNYQQPSRAQVCLRQDLVARGGVGGTAIWNDVQ